MNPIRVHLVGLESLDRLDLKLDRAHRYHATECALLLLDDETLVDRPVQHIEQVAAHASFERVVDVAFTHVVEGR